MRAKKEMYNWEDTYRGVIHLASPGGGYEYTLCGLAWDEPSSEYGADVMEQTSKACTCRDCIGHARFLLPYLKREISRIDKGTYHKEK